MLYELLVTLVLALLAGVCSIKSLTAGVEMINAAAQISFLTQEASGMNFALQKLMGDSVNFTLYATPDDARNNNTAALVTENAAAVRLVFADGRVVVIYFDTGTKRLYFQNITPTNSQWIIDAGFENVSFHLHDPQDSQVTGLIVVTLDKGGRRISCYVERY